MACCISSLSSSGSSLGKAYSAFVSALCCHIHTMGHLTRTAIAMVSSSVLENTSIYFRCDGGQRTWPSVIMKDLALRIYRIRR